MSALATIRRHAESHRALALSDAYSEQEAPRLEAALAAVAELIDADREFDAASAAMTAHYRAVAEGGYLRPRFPDARELSRRYVAAEARRACAIDALAGAA